MINKDLNKKLRKIKAVTFDGDGVLFTGRVMVGTKKGEVLKERSHIDGQGISLLRAIGVRIAFVSGEKTGFVEILGKKLNSIPSVKNGKWPKIAIFVGMQGKDKIISVEKWLKKISIKWEECAAMGDDLSDFQLLKRVGFVVAPAQAEEIIKKNADYITPRKGGDGAIRDFCNLILKARGIDSSNLILR